MFFDAQHVNSLVDNAKCAYYRAQVDEAPDQKSMFKVVDSLLHRNKDPRLPTNDNSKELAEKFSDFFVNKMF